VALRTMFTISMALGSLELVKKGVLTARLSAIEDAATMSVLCADKTGTITMNKLSVEEASPYGKHSENEVILYGSLLIRKFWSTI
jgi:H+-transporting ATPase